MSREERMQLLAERTFLKRLMERTPAKARLTIMSDKHRLQQIEERLASLPPDDTPPGEIRSDLHGCFIGILPESRAFGFRRADDGEVIHGKVSSQLDQIEAISNHLNAPARISVTQIPFSGYVLDTSPEWQQPDVAGAS